MSLPLIAEAFGLAALIGGTLSVVVLPVVTYWIAPFVVLLVLLWCLEQPINESFSSVLELGIRCIGYVADILAPLALHIFWTDWLILVIGCMLLALRCLPTRFASYFWLLRTTDSVTSRLSRYRG